MSVNSTAIHSAYCSSLATLLFYLVHIGNKESLDVSFMELSKRAPTLAVYVAGYKAFPWITSVCGV